jgi:hypothetical protein
MSVLVTTRWIPDGLKLLAMNNRLSFLRRKRKKLCGYWVQLCYNADKDTLWKLDTIIAATTLEIAVIEMEIDVLSNTIYSVDKNGKLIKE